MPKPIFEFDFIDTLKNPLLPNRKQRVLNIVHLFRKHRRGKITVSCIGKQNHDVFVRVLGSLRH